MGNGCGVHYCKFHFKTGSKKEFRSDEKKWEMVAVCTIVHSTSKQGVRRNYGVTEGKEKRRG